MSYHLPVLAQACLDGLNITPDGVYVDATFGGGGHSRLILEALGPKGKLIAFDQDADAAANEIDDERFVFVPHNFRHLKRFLRLHGHRKIDGILADLGVSSHQLDVAERGFSFRFSGELDMRMNQREGQTAADVLNSYTAEELQDLLSKNAELRNAKTVAQAIVNARQQRPFVLIEDLLQTLGPHIRGQRNRYLAQVFQAIRMEVNDELGALRDFLEQCQDVLIPGCHLVVLTYHSIEDRYVKHLMKTGNTDGQAVKDDFGRIFRPYKLVNRKPILPDEVEIRENSRARSAKLRIAARTEEQQEDFLPPTHT